MFKQDQDIFNVLLGAVSEGVVIVDEEQNIVEVNQSALKMFGYKKGDLLKKPLNILIPRNYHSDHGKHVDGFMKKQTRRRMGQGRDIFGARKDGTTFPVEAGLNPFSIYDKNYVMALVIDITVRKAAEQELKHWSKIFNQSLNEIYIFKTDDLKFVNVNSGALNNMGY
ncbi:MAG: PAS domain S-box protein, partial [Flavobacteriaceae bacterium]|nr:PAS domain S-box protein [Flavobacteriaceae bacterium]